MEGQAGRPFQVADIPDADLIDLGQTPHRLHIDKVVAQLYYSKVTYHPLSLLHSILPKSRLGANG
jgi:hypothetical protein